MWEIIKNWVGFWFDTMRELGPALAARVMVGMGIGLASYNVLLPELVQYIQQFLWDLPDAWIQLLGILKIDVCLTILFSAMATKLGTKVQPIRLRETGAGE